MIKPSFQSERTAFMSPMGYQSPRSLETADFSPYTTDSVQLGNTPNESGLYNPKMFQSRFQDDPPVSNPVLTKEEFLQKYGDKTVSATTKLPGMAYLDRADLNLDGVISGQAEWEAAFRQVDMYDKDGKAGSVNTTSDARVGQSLANLEAAPDGATAQRPAYTQKQLQRMSYAMEAPTVHANSAQKLKAGTKDYLGRPLSPNAVSLPLSAGAGNGLTLVADPKSGRLYKQGPEGGAIVPLTPEEQKKLKKGLESEAPDPTMDGNEAYAKAYYTVFPERRPEECSY